MLHCVHKRKYTKPQPVQLPTEVDGERSNFYILASSIIAN